MKKLCKKCGRKRKIGKFGKLSASPDGKNPYCRDCMNSFRNAYKMTPSGRLKQKNSAIKWRKLNKNKISDYNRKYYDRNKERLKEKVKKSREDKALKKINKIKISKEIVINPKPIRGRKK